MIQELKIPHEGAPDTEWYAFLAQRPLFKDRPENLESDDLSKLIAMAKTAYLKYRPRSTDCPLPHSALPPPALEKDKPLQGSVSEYDKPDDDDPSSSEEEDEAIDMRNKFVQVGAIQRVKVGAWDKSSVEVDIRPGYTVNWEWEMARSEPLSHNVKFELNLINGRGDRVGDKPDQQGVFRMRQNRGTYCFNKKCEKQPLLNDANALQFVFDNEFSW